MPGLVRARTELSGPGLVRSHLISLARPATQKWRQIIIPYENLSLEPLLTVSPARCHTGRFLISVIIISRHSLSLSLAPGSGSDTDGISGPSVTHVILLLVIRADRDEDGHETRRVWGTGNIQPRTAPGTHSNYHILMLIIFSFCAHEGVQVHYPSVRGDQWWC